MKRWKLQTSALLIANLTQLPSALAHPGHQHPASDWEKLFHTLLTDWNMLIAVALATGILFYKRRNSKTRNHEQ